MSERYTRLYSLPENQYALGAPLLIAAGALLKDNQSGKTLAQLKFRNLSNKRISAVKIAIDAFDISGKALESVVEYQYLDLNIARGNAFGQKQAVPLPNAVTRSFTAKCIEVVFSDGTAWKAAEDARWNALPVQETIENRLGRLSAQYRRDTSTLSKYALLECDDLWLCTCGAINHKEEVECYCCYSKKTELLDAMELKGLQQRNADYEKGETEKAEKQTAADAAQRAKTTKFAIIAVAVILIIYLVLLLTTKVIIPNSKYNNAVALMDSGKYGDAISAFEALEGYKDSVDQISACEIAILDGKYDDAVALMDAGDYEYAIAAFEALDKYKDSEAKINECRISILDKKYDAAVTLMNADQYQNAIVAFAELDGYKDSISNIEQCYSAILGDTVWNSLKNATVGKTITFGNYEQDNNLPNGAEAIEWLVIGKEEGRLLVISKHALAFECYNTTLEDTTWETCTLRQWLYSFVDTAFSADEKTLIPTVSISADRNPDYNTEAGNATQDRVFLLSVDEANKYLNSDSARMCQASEYANPSKEYVNSDGNCKWWLRTSGNVQNHAACVKINGKIDTFGAYASYWMCAVRPAMWIDLSALN